MAQKIVLEIDVDGAELDQLNSDLKKTGDNLEKVESQSKKAKTGLKDVGDNGGAIAVLDSLTGGLATKTRDAAEATKLLNVSLKGTKTALIATGIGAFVVAVGLVMAYWEEIEEFITGSNRKLQEQIDLLRKQQDVNKSNIDLVSSQLELLNLQGEATEELQKQKIALIENQKELNAEEIATLEIQVERLKVSALELTTREKIVRAVMNAASSGSGDLFILSKQVEAAEKYEELQDIITKAKKEQVDLDILLFNTINKAGQADSTKTKRGDFSAFEAEADARVKRAEEERVFLETIAAIRKEFADKNFEKELIDEELRVELRRQQKLAEIEELKLDEVFKRQAILEVNEYYDTLELEAKQKKADAENEIDTINFNNKMELLSATGSGLSSLTDIIGKQTAAGKGLAVAGALIDTYAAIAKNLKAFAGVPIPGYAIAQSIATGLSGFAAVKNILSVQVPGGGSTAGGSAGALGGGFQPAAPSFNIVGDAGINQLTETIGITTNAPVRAYVTSGDIEEGQDLKRNAVNSSSLG